MLYKCLLFLLSRGLEQNRLSGPVGGEGAEGGQDQDQRSQFSILAGLQGVHKRGLPTDALKDHDCECGRMNKTRDAGLEQSQGF